MSTTQSTRKRTSFMSICTWWGYPTEMITRCFEYFAISRAVYSRLCKDYQLPSVRTLTRITSKFSSFTDTQFISKFFGKLPKLKRKCVILIDEVYVKAGLRYHGGSIFGKAANDPTQLARTVLCIMWLRVSLEARASSLR